MAQQINMSEFHFHRVFKSVTNEPFNQYLQRKRLEQALFELRAPKQESIQKIAFNCGFSSQANFAKAFSNYFGFTASFYRKKLNPEPKHIENSKNGKLSSKIGKNIQPHQLYHGTLSKQDNDLIKQQCLSIGIIDVDEAHYCYLASTDGYSIEGIGQAWEQLKVLLASLNIPLYRKNHSVAFCRDNHFLTPEVQCRYEAGYKIDDPQRLIERGIGVRTVAAGQYLSAMFKGKISELRHPFYLWLFSQHIPENKIILASKTVIERYHEVDMKNNFIHLEVLIKVY
ncbi:MAG: helix-turn-helix domain-containing protein [Oleispira sp.]|nr:helix-turn-helix domain-containing protein [Oleispira sp.]